MDYLDYWTCQLDAGRVGEARIEKFSVSPNEARLSSLRGDFILPDDYTRLYVDGTMMMSDTRKELRDHLAFLHNARGNVLINGLGLGCCLNVVLHKPEVEHVTVVESHADVIALVGPHFPEATIIHADAMTWRPPQGVRFDAVWHDIWADICLDNLPQMHTLHRRYGRRADWQGSWSRAELEYRRTASR